ncbi:Rcs stress response system protein RcsF [Pseudocolwellia sp. HL-MZ19]|uniref:Rcs stress response system protein RcsF n=1 Tax=unclassified Pseudocolwellia TaxID=2848178 RepID=UPI003CF18555
MKNTLLTLLALSLLASCSSKFDTSTNLDAENFTNYFAPSKVKIYPSITDITGPHKYLGVVEGEDCQLKAHHAKPDEVIARTDARKKASELKANAIVFSGCTMLTGGSTAKQCIATTVCYGQAYYLKPTSSK